MSPMTLQDYIDEGAREHGDDIRDDIRSAVSGRSFHERLLLALIRSHPVEPGGDHDKNSDAKRLRAAM